MEHRAYSTFRLKSFDESTGLFEGIASTPTTDRMGDVVEPKGAKFTLPLPLLWQHRASEPIGLITAAKITGDGIAVTGKVMKDLLPRIAEAWTLIRAGLVRGLSIGFQPLENEPISKKDGPFGPQRFTSWDWLELSAVTIPANSEANIQVIRSMDAPYLRAASGNTGPTVQTIDTTRAGATARTEGKTMKTIEARIAEAEGLRSQAVARMKELMDSSGGDIGSLEAEDVREYDGKLAEVGTLDADLRRLKGHQAAINGAVPVTSDTGNDPDKASKARQGGRIQMGKSNLPPGTRFARAVIAMAAGRGSRSDAAEIAKQRWGAETPEVVEYIKATAGGTGGGTTDGDWAANFNVQNVIDNEFIELLRPATILGRIQGLRSAVFNTKMVVQTGGSTVAWVGPGAAKPVGELALDFVSIDIAKCAGIVVLTEEQIMTSHPDSEQAVRGDLVEQVSQFLDIQFTDPGVAAVAGTNPASITNGVTPIPASGITANHLRVDLTAALATFTDANMGVQGLTIVTRSDVAMGIALLTNALGQPEFSTVSMSGGTLFGMPLIVSDNVPADTGGSPLILLKPSEVLVASAGGVRVDASREATLDMAGGDTPTFNLWQKNCVALRAERFISWAKRRPQAVAYISGANYHVTAT